MPDLTYRLVNGLVRLFFRLLRLRIDVRGVEHIPLDGLAVLACNHIGFLDFTFVARAGPLVPMVVWGSHRLSTVDRRGSLRHAIPITVLVGAPIHATIDA